MITSLTSIGRLARQTRAVSLPLLVAGALAVGCGTVSAGSPGGPNQPAGGTASSASSASASASSRPTPVPTVSGGPVGAGETACVGWPADAPHGKLTAFFEPVAAERCMIGFQTIRGKEWETATLEKSTGDLAALVRVLLQPSGGLHPGVFCPEFAVIPPQVLLINSAGRKLIPSLPVGGCGIVNARILSTLAQMSWQPLSVRLITRVPPAVAPRTLPGASVGPIRPGAPKAIKTGTPASAD